MDVIKKIQKRIKAFRLFGEVEEVQITKEEAEQLGERKEIDGVKLIVVDKLGDMSRKDCFAYNNGNCSALNKLYCKNRKCSFYSNNVNMKKIEKDIKKYSTKHGG